jgi:hypothetical protein
MHPHQMRYPTATVRGDAIGQRLAGQRSGPFVDRLAGKRVTAKSSTNQNEKL